MKQKYAVSGMSCSACSANIEKNVGKLNGINDISVSLLQNSMVVDYDENIISDNDIINAVVACGYGASVFGEENKKAEIKETDEQEEILKFRLIPSVILMLPLLYLTMGHMVGLPLPHFLHGAQNSVSMAFSQMLISLPIIYLNRKFFFSGFKALFHRLPNMDSLIAVGSASAFLYGIFAIYRMSYGLGSGDLELVLHYRNDLYFESSAMILTLITLGKYLEAKSKGRTGDAVKKLLNLAPQTTILEIMGKEVVTPSSEVKKGDICIIKQGSSIPCDGIVTEGTGYVDQSAITGESIPVFKEKGDNLTGATILKSGFFKMEAQKVGSETTLSKIIELVEAASASKAPIAKLADKISSYFVPAVMTISLATAVVWLILGQNFEFSLARAITVLVISCPCALGLATPTAIMVGTGVGAQNGILIKSAESLEQLCKTQTIIFDKTGTITEGKPSVTDFINLSEISQDKFLQIFSSVESLSEHPLSIAVCEYAKENNVFPVTASDFSATEGQGVSAKIDEKQYYCGNEKMMKNLNIDLSRAKTFCETFYSEGKTVLFACDEDKVLGIFAVADKIKKSSQTAIKALSQMGIKTVMLTGDNKSTALHVKEAVGIDDVMSDVMPQEKEEHIAKLQKGGEAVAMVGDGINDAPALARADVGIAIGAGTDIAIDSADVVLIRSDLLQVVSAIELSRSVLKNIKENLFWALFYNTLCIPVAAGVLIFPFGIRLNPMIGAAAMSISSLFVVANALRLRSFKGTYNETYKSQEIKITERRSETMKKTMSVEGMMCLHCKTMVEKVLRELDGVTEVDVNLYENTATVTLSKEVSNDVLSKAVTDAGYKVNEIR